ncbi:MAG: PEP-CTERM sorting domain-containing protein, partial [Gemmatimonadetes bacterium]|nr:PEP-CTERM sorting domain-containing protein [Pseudomonadales bacterium]NIW37146.1 PEP-CTERM sorting domain-containing protein [Gemmatimonadota bacterium]NIX08274.1 PEP-CTERM sorting domain-containing protein [Pseudomonadales bacterium]
QLITPGQIATNLPLGTSDKMAALVILVVHFIPEPGLLLLLGSGVVGLTVLGQRRLRG